MNNSGIFRFYVFFPVGLSLFLLNSCASVKIPELIRAEHLQLGKIEGKTVYLSADLIVKNPNRFNITVKPSHVTFHVENHTMGEVYLDEKLTLKSNRESFITVPFHIALEDGAMLTALKYALKDSITIRMHGEIKGSVLLLSKKVPVNQSQRVSGNLLKIGLKN
jgi:LEA14-like dessication related protein